MPLQIAINFSLLLFLSKVDMPAWYVNGLYSLIWFKNKTSIYWSSGVQLWNEKNIDSAYSSKTYDCHYAVIRKNTP